MAKKSVKGDKNEASLPAKVPKSLKGYKVEIEEKSQAVRILEKFGGPQRLAEILKEIGREKHRISIYKWTYSREKGGTGGLIPTAAWPDVFAAARREGILITPEDIDPRPQLLRRLRKPKSEDE